MIERRALLAAFLSMAFLLVYSHIMARSAQRRQPSTPAGVTAPAIPELRPLPQINQPPAFLYHTEKEEVVTIASDAIVMGIGRESGAVRSVALPAFKDEHGNTPLVFKGALPLAHLRVGEEALTVTAIDAQGSEARVTVQDKQTHEYHLIYALDKSNPLINMRLTSNSPLNRSSQAIITSSWSRADAMAGQNNRLEAYALQASNGKHKHFVGPWKKERIVPRGTKAMALSERYFCEILRVNPETDDLRLVPVMGEVLVTELRVPLRQEAGELYSTSIYVGPRDYFHLKKTEFINAFPIGIIGQIGLALLLLLSWVAAITHNYGLAIIIFSLAVTAMTAPFTLMSFRSMKKMQELKPRIDKLTEQHKSDPKRMNQEVFALYKEHRVSPLGGCLPMLLQMPIFIALFQGISHFIELRGASFLWIKDLSLPDRIAQLPVTLPLLGDGVNLLPAVMALAMYLQTQASQKTMGSSAANNPTAQMMSGPIMPVVFFVMFYHFPAGLVLYWLMNSLSSMALYRLSK